MAIETKAVLVSVAVAVLFFSSVIRVYTLNRPPSDSINTTMADYEALQDQGREEGAEGGSEEDAEWGWVMPLCLIVVVGAILFICGVFVLALDDVGAQPPKLYHRVYDEYGNVVGWQEIQPQQQRSWFFFFWWEGE